MQKSIVEKRIFMSYDLPINHPNGVMALFHCLALKGGKMAQKTESDVSAHKENTDVQICFSLTPEQVQTLLRIMPEEMAGTREWKLRVQVRATVEFIDKNGFILSFR
jgi:hypothetical protein